MKRGKKGLVLAGALLLTMFALTGCGKTKINLNDYVEVNFSGYNTAGQAEINELKIRNDIILDHWETFGLTEEQHENDRLPPMRIHVSSWRVFLIHWIR